MRLPMSAIDLGVKISHGAFGEVYRGTLNAHPVAIKQLSPQHRKSTKLIICFLNEAKLTASIRHERIIDLIGVAWTNTANVLVVTEYMGGGDLRELLAMYQDEDRPTGFESLEKLKIALHTIDALAYLHSRQPTPVLHRDLKSRNILLSMKLDAKLIDFGVSRERADLTMTAGVGTLRWMAPEVMLGERYGPAADIFSYGAVLSELDTHMIPYTHNGQSRPDAAIIKMVIDGTLHVDFTEPETHAVVRLARACMSRDPSSRPSAAVVAAQIRHILELYRIGADSDGTIATTALVDSHGFYV
ncbi:hypothetical protein PINS_up009685 [Pythium insidiosum]|nr:hypothetical protein PINS_up009685 [Pythium insidiosum]